MRSEIFHKKSVRILPTGAIVLGITAVLMFCLCFYIPEDIAARLLFSALVILLHILSVFIGSYLWGSRNWQPETPEEDPWDTARDVIGNITHDLKTPLTAVHGYAQGILDGVAFSPDRLNKYATMIRNKSEDMEHIIDDLSFFAQVFQNNLQYSMEEISANDYFSSCISSLSLDMEIRRISLIYYCHADPGVKVFIDKEKIRRVINNIVENSSKYIRTELGVVTMTVEENETDIIVHIADNGEGIENEDLFKIFEQFYRTDKSRNSSTGGSGLGLAIAKKITEDHNGTIWADSIIGRGTAISFSLPKIRDRAAAK